MWVLGLVVAIDQADQNVLRGVQELLKKEFGFNDFTIGMLGSAFVLVNALTTVPAGYLADRWNRKRAIGRTIVLWSGFTALTAACANFVQLFAVRGLLGFGQGISEPSAGSLISDYYPTEQRGKAFSNQQVMFFVGAGLGVALGGGIGEKFGWRWAFVAVGLPGAVVAALVLRLKEPRRGHSDRLSLGIEEPLDGDDLEQPPLFQHGFRVFVGDMARGLRDDFRTILRIPTLRYSMVGVGALLFTVTGVGFWLPAFYHRYHGLSETKATTFVGVVLGLGGIVGTVVGGRIADTWQNKIKGARLAIPAYALLLGAAVFFVSWFRMPLAADVAIQLVGMFVITISIPALRAGLADAVPAHLRGAGFAAFTLVSTVCGAAAAPPILGVLSDILGKTDGLRYAFMICTPPVALGGLVLLRARNHLDEDVAKIMMAIQEAYVEQEALEQQRAAEEAAEAGTT
jgi:MFS family permease